MKGTLNIVNPFPNKPWFLRVCSTSLLKTLRVKEKLLKQFLLFPQCFLPFWRTLSFSTNSKLSSAHALNLEKSKISLFGKGLNDICTMKGPVAAKNKDNESHQATFINLVLTHYLTMPHFDTLRIYSCGKNYEKRRNCL